MSEAKHYEVDDFRFEFTSQGDPYKGMLITRAPEVEPYTAEVTLSKPRSCNEYASRGHEICGMSKSALKVALNALCSRRYEEVAAAKEAEQEETDQAEEYPEVTDEEIDELVGKPGVLGRLVESVATYSRVVKEWNVLKLISLQSLSAQLELLPNDKPIGSNVIVTAEAGRGKNYVCDAVARVLPPEFYFAFESSSAMALYYRAVDDPTFLKHHWIYPNEAEAADLLVEMFRPLLSGGSARHITVNKDASGRNVGAEFVIEGPVTLAIPTVRNKLDGQLQTRMLIAGLEDYPGRVADHSREVSRLISSGYAATDYSGEILAWQVALRSLTGIRRVVTPVEHERFCFDSDNVSHGARLWTNVLGLMCAHAWLEQKNREIRELPNGERAIVATPEDYEVAYEIFEETCERSLVNLSGAHRKILNATYELQEALESEGKLLPSSGFTQRKIATAAGVSQSTVSENKTFLVKSVKFMRQTDEGGLLLVEGAEPSWWEKGDALDGFPRPEEVRGWWSGNSSPLDSEHTDRADQDVEESVTQHDEGAKGDRHPTDRGREATDHRRADDHTPNRDRKDDGNDREASDQESDLPKGDIMPDGEAIGTIGDSGDEGAQLVLPPQDEGGYDNPSDRVPHPQRENQDSEKNSWDKPVENAHEDLAEPLIQNVANDDSIRSAASTTEAPPTELHDPGYRGYSFLRIPPSKRGPLTERAARIEAILRRHYLEYPQDWKSRRNVGEGSIFDDLDPAPSSGEVRRVDQMISRINPGEDIPPPLEEAPVMDTKFLLNHVLPLIRNGYAYDERDPAVLIDAVAANRLTFFVPTREEMMEAMRQMGLEPTPVYSEPEDSASARTSGCEMSEVEEAIRRAQRAPRTLWPANSGSPNVVQEWVRQRGNVREKSRALRDISSFLQTEGYLASEPSTVEVSEAMDKLVTEIKVAAVVVVQNRMTSAL